MKKGLLVLSSFVIALSCILIFGSFGRRPIGLMAEKAERRPNIILIMADDLGFSDLGCFLAKRNQGKKRKL